MGPILIDGKVMMRSLKHLLMCVILFVLVIVAAAQAQQKPRITLDEFFNSVTITTVKISPDGQSVLIATRQADWAQERFRRDIWIYREGSAGPVLLTQSGRDSSPEWSPDGKWISFLSDRKLTSANSGDAKEKEITQLYLISPSGGEAFPVTRGEESVGEFAWAPDATALYFTTRVPWTKAMRDQYKKDWNDVRRFRESQRGDVIARIQLSAVLANLGHLPPTAAQKKTDADAKGETAETPGAEIIATTPYSVGELAASPDNKTIAFTTDPPSHIIEDLDSYEIYLLDTKGEQPQPHRLTQNRVIESGLRWSADGRQLFFRIHGDVESGYQQIQGRLYAIDVTSKSVTRWANEFQGSVSDCEVMSTGSVVGTGTRGTQVEVFYQPAPAKPAGVVPGWPGTYNSLSLASRSQRVAFIFSSLEHPHEVYIADSLDKLREARPISSFNKLFTERALPQGVPYKWKADDGSEVEGMLIYPPGKFGAKHLRMLTLIHGGPAAADGNKFRADHYDWAILAASNDWLVFRPNYRGSTGYGDKFQRDISPQILTRPGKDILEGIDALVRDGIADPDQLTIGGYSYGGYLTNWLITQTTRFKAAVSGAGAVEHAANWGNDDLTFDDAWYLGGAPWESPKNYNDEAALWQINKVKTPTHIVAGDSDVRVATAEAYLLERALHTLGVPTTLLLFPGEGHSLGKNPWHGKIKVREELKWLETYTNVNGGGAPAH